MIGTAISCQGRTITVDDDNPADFNNIQAAIDDASDGDIGEIQPGTYNHTEAEKDKMTYRAAISPELCEKGLMLPGNKQIL